MTLKEIVALNELPPIGCPPHIKTCSVHCSLEDKTDELRTEVAKNFTRKSS